MPRFPIILHVPLRVPLSEAEGGQIGVCPPVSPHVFVEGGQIEGARKLFFFIGLLIVSPLSPRVPL